MWEKSFKPWVPKNEARAETRNLWAAADPRKFSIRKLMPGYEQSAYEEEDEYHFRILRKIWEQIVDKAVTPQEFNQALSFYGKRVWESRDVESAIMDLRHMSYVLLMTKPGEKVIDHLGPEDLTPRFSSQGFTSLELDAGGPLRAFAHWTHEQLLDLMKQILKQGPKYQGAPETKTDSPYRASARFDDQDVLKELCKQYSEFAVNNELAKEEMKNLRALLGS